MRAGSAPWLVATWVALDVGIAVYLALDGVNAVSTAMLVLAAVAYVVAVVASDRPWSSAQGVLFAIVAAQAVVRAIVPYRSGSTSAERLLPGAALVALVLWLVALWSTVVRPKPRLTAACLLCIAGLGVACRVTIVGLDGYPTFDVPLIQEAAARAIHAGSDPT